MQWCAAKSCVVRGVVALRNRPVIQRLPCVCPALYAPQSCPSLPAPRTVRQRQRARPPHRSGQQGHLRFYRCSSERGAGRLADGRVNCPAGAERSPGSPDLLPPHHAAVRAFWIGCARDVEIVQAVQSQMRISQEMVQTRSSRKSLKPPLGLHRLHSIGEGRSVRDATLDTGPAPHGGRKRGSAPPRNRAEMGVPIPLATAPTSAVIAARRRSRPQAESMSLGAPCLASQSR